MSSQAIELESKLISAVARIEEIAAISALMLEGDMSRTDFGHPGIFRLTRAIDTLAHGELAQQAKT